MNTISPVSFGSLFHPKGSKIKNTAANFISGLNGPPQDTFSPKIVCLDMKGPHGRNNLEGRVIKNIKLKDSKGKKVSGCILESTKTSNEYYAATKDEVLCRMRLDEWTNYMYVSELYGQANNGKYKGAGTELLKFAVQKSKEKGYSGRLKLTIGGSPKFYYKNNFRIDKERSKDYIRQNAVLDCMTRLNLYADDIWGKYWGTANVTLEPKEAEALLEGKRLYNETHSEYMGEVEIEYEVKGEKRKKTVGIDFADLSNCTTTKDVFVAQAYSKNGEKMTPIANIEMRLLEDENGDKYLNIDAFNTNWIAREAVTEVLMGAVNQKMKELGAKYIKTDDAKTGNF